MGRVSGLFALLGLAGRWFEQPLARVLRQAPKHLLVWRPMCIGRTSFSSSAHAPHPLFETSRSPIMDTNPSARLGQSNDLFPIPNIPRLP